MIELAVSLNGGFSSFPLAPLYMGREQCDPGHRYGRVRREYLMHYVASGAGTFRTGAGLRRLTGGMAFLIRPGEEHWYEADSQQPWEYWWLGFAAPELGELERWAGLANVPAVVTFAPAHRRKFEIAYNRLWDLLFGRPSSPPPILFAEPFIAVLRILLSESITISMEPAEFPLRRERFESAAAGSPRAREEILLNRLRLGPEGGAKKKEEEQWSRVAAFLKAHFTEPITVEQMCRWVGVSRAGLRRLTIRRLGLSPKEVLTRLRMERAAVLLRGTTGSNGAGRPIHRVAALCGYREYQTFERQFRRYYGVTPSNFCD